MVADSTGRGRVYGMDVQKIALESTSSLLDQFASQDEVAFIASAYFVSPALINVAILPNDPISRSS